MPANYVWAPPAGMPGMPPPPPPSFSTLTNWRVGLGPTDFATELPNYDDHLIFNGGISSASCVIPEQTVTSGQNTFAGIHLQFGLAATPQPIGSPPVPPTNVPYSGTVTLSNSFPVGELEVDCGVICQNDADDIANFAHAGTLTVTSVLDWTGGTLNSNTVAGTIALAPGATGVAEPSFTNPGINQTVALGSTIELLGPPISETTGVGSFLDVLSGFYNISNDAGFVVNNQCSLRLLPDPGDAPRGGGGQQALIADVQLSDTGTEKTKAGSVTVEKGGQATFKPRERPTNSTAPAKYKSDGFLLNNGGTVKIIDTTEVTFTGTNNGEFNDYSVLQTSGQPDGIFQVEGGCTILTKKGVCIRSGKFHILTATRDPITQNTATVGLAPGSLITTALVLAGGELKMPQGQVRNLNVVGDFNWTGGVIELYLSTSPDKSSDRIVMTGGDMLITNTPTLKLRWDEAGMRAMAKDSTWHLIEVAAQKQITGAYNPDYADVNTAGNIEMDVNTSANKREVKAQKSNDPQ